MRRAFTATSGAVGALLILAGCGAGSSGALSAPTAPPAPPAAPAAPSSSPSSSPTRSTVPDPLTGVPVSRRTAALPALSVKIDNLPQARPQAGLDQADLVFEALVEGGLTRFLAVFHAHGAPLVGPVRSARPVDAALLRALGGGIFGFSGAAAGEIAPVNAYSHATLVEPSTTAAPFFLQPGRYAPQNLFSTTAKLRAAGSALGPRQPAPPHLFDFSAAPLPGQPAVHAATVDLSGVSSASWTYQPGDHSWLRAENGTPHLAADGQQIRAADVVVLRVRVAHSGITDAAGHEDPFDLAYGSGAVTALRDGVAEQGSWSRPTVSDPFTFTAAGGGPLPLRPGRIWVELLPAGGPFPTSGSLSLR